MGDSEVIRVKNREGSKVSFRAVRIKLRNGKLKYRVQWTEAINGVKKRIYKANDSMKSGKSNHYHSLGNGRKPKSQLPAKMGSVPPPSPNSSSKMRNTRLDSYPTTQLTRKRLNFFLDGSPDENKSIKEAHDVWMLSGRDEENLRKVSLDAGKNRLRAFIKKQGWHSLGWRLMRKWFRPSFSSLQNATDCDWLPIQLQGIFNFCIKRMGPKTTHPSHPSTQYH